MKTQIFSRIIACLIIVFSSFYSFSKSIYVNDGSQINDIYTTAIGKSGNSGSKSSPFGSLKDALAVVASNDIIYIDAGKYFGGPSDPNNRMKISVDNVKIIGAGMAYTVFDGKKADRWFLNIRANNIIIEDMYVTNYSQSIGCAQVFDISGAKYIGIQFNRVKIDGNGAQNGEYPVLIANGSSVTFDGGGSSCNKGWWNAGGYYIKENSSVIFSNYLFYGNERQEDGAALKVEDSQVTVKNSVFKGNFTDTDFKAAAIYISGANSDVKIYDSYIDSNGTSVSTSKNYGNAIYISSGKLLITRSILQNNDLSKSLGIGTNPCVGTIAVAGGVVTIDSCKFSKNNANLANDIYVSSGVVTAHNCTFGGKVTELLKNGGTFDVYDSGNPSGTANLKNTNLSSYIPNPSVPKTLGDCVKGIKICNPAKATATVAACDGKATLTGTGPSGSIFYWYDNKSDASNHALNTSIKYKDTSSTVTPNYDVTVTQTTSYWVVSNLDGCVTPTEVVVTYNCPGCNPPTIPNFPTSACPKDTIKYITQSGQTNYVWTIPGVLGTDYQIIPPGKSTSDTLVLKWLTTGDKVVTVTYKDASNCTATSSNTNKTSVGSLSTGVFTIQPSANSCQNTSIKYAANNTNSNFKWVIDNNTGTAGTDYEIVAGGKTKDDTLIIKWKTTGNHTVELDYTASGGCATTTAAKNTTKVVARPKLPLSPFQDTVQPICTDPFGSVLLNLPSLGNWTISSLPAVGNPKVVTNQNTYRFGDLLKKTKYKFFVVDTDGCFSDTTSEVTMNDIPGQPEIFGADTICMVNNLTLSAWTDKNKTKASTPNALNPWVSSDLTIATISNLGVVTSLNKSGKVRITYTDNANCTQFDSIVVAEKAVSGTTSFSVDTICVSDTKSIVLTGFSPLYKIQWQDSIAGSGVWKDTNITSASFIIPTSIPGDYFYRAMVKNTFCSDNAVSKLVKVVVLGLPAPTFVDTIQPTCTIATGGVTSNMQYNGYWTIKAIADPNSTGVSKDTTGTVNVIPYSLSLKGLKPGKYTFQVKSSKGCFSKASASIDINPQPTIPAKPVLDGAVIYCASKDYKLDTIQFNPKPVAPLTVKYFDKNGIQITTPNLEKVKANEDYMFVFDNGSCTSKDTLITKIPMDKGPTLPLNGTNLSLTAICAVEKPTFNTLFAKLPSIDTSLYSFHITPDTIIKPINYLPNKIIIGSNGGNLQEFYYTLADKVNGCKNTVFAKLSFKLDEGPKNLNIKSSQLFCGFSNPTVAKLDTAATKASPTNSFVWYSSDISNSPLPSNTPLIPGTYYGAEKENPGCESVERNPVVVTIENFGPTTVDPNNVYAFCKGSNKKVSDLPISPYSTTNFVWLDSYKKEIANPKNTALIPGIYYAAEFKNGCISDKSQKIEVQFESPIISITPSRLPTCGVGNGALTIIGADNNLTYQWFKNNDTLVDSTKSYITNLPFDYTIEYKVIAKDKNGCIDSAKTKFSDCEPPGIPHVITLYKDGKNDVFKLHYDTKYPNCKLSIFNRWGAMVYESKEKPYKDDWDGKSNVAGTLGTGELPTGTYFYLIDKGDGSALESGYVELVK